MNEKGFVNPMWSRYRVERYIISALNFTTFHVKTKIGTTAVYMYKEIVTNLAVSRKNKTFLFLLLYTVRIDKEHWLESSVNG